MPTRPSNERAKPRILLVGPSLRILGGQAIQLQRLLEGLRADGRVEADFLPVNPQLPGWLGELQKIKYVRTAVTSVSYLLSLRRHVPRYDLIHAFSASYWSFILAPAPAILAGRWYGRPVVLNYRSGEADDHLAHWPLSTRPILRRTSRIVVPSGYLVDVFGQYGWSAQAIPNCPDFSRLRFRVRNPLRPVFLSNRNFEAHYNVACVIRAFARVAACYPAAKLLIAGDGPEGPALRRQAAELALTGAEFLGRVEPDRMPGLVDTADIYLNAPNLDNMPTSILESFAAGLPVVSSDAGGIPWIVDHGRTGLLVRRDDDAAMAAAAISLLENPSLASSLTEAARREVERYRWENVRNQWVELYTNLSGSRAAC